MAQKAIYDPATKRFRVEDTTVPSVPKNALDLSHMSKAELYEEGKRIAKVLVDDYDQPEPYTMWGGKIRIRLDGKIVKGGRKLRYSRHRYNHTALTIDDVPKEVLERIVYNGKRQLGRIERDIEAQLIKYPEITAEGALEGKSKAELIYALYSYKMRELRSIFTGLYPEYRTHCWIRVMLGKSYYELHVDLHGRGASVSCTPSGNIKDRLVFIENFNTAKEAFLSQRRWFRGGTG